jgi:hypothetical protein
MIVIFGFIAAIVGSLLIGYSFGLRAGMRDPLVGDTRSIESEAAQNVNRSVDPVADLRDVLFRKPATDRERTIAEAVDEKFLGNPGNRQPTIRDYLDISAALDFVMSASDSQFLVEYLRWRLAHPMRRTVSR